MGLSYIPGIYWQLLFTPLESWRQVSDRAAVYLEVACVWDENGSGGVNPFFDSKWISLVSSRVEP